MFRAAELPAKLAYSDSLHDFTLEIEGQLDIFQTEDTGSAISSNWEENRAVSHYGTDGLTVRGDSHITDTTIFQADGSSQVNEFASQFQYENGVLLRTAVLPSPVPPALRYPLQSIWIWSCRTAPVSRKSVRKRQKTAPPSTIWI